MVIYSSTDIEWNVIEGTVDENLMWSDNLHIRVSVQIIVILCSAILQNYTHCDG